MSRKLKEADGKVMEWEQRMADLEKERSVI
jgi:hypothetical protein